jgi:hypothetical protein
MSAICPSIFGALGRNSNYPSLPPPLLRREWTNRSRRGRVFGWVKSLFGSYPRHSLAEPTRTTGGPEEPPDESDIASCMEDPLFWMLVGMH